MSEMNSEELALKARKTLGTMLDYLGLNAELKAEVTENQLALKIKSTEPGRIIGRKGQTLDSLQLLLNRIMFKGDEDCPRISIDIDGYAENGSRSERPRRERTERGERGEQGIQGERGEQGIQGERGEQGIQGPPGADGVGSVNEIKTFSKKYAIIFG